MASNIVMGVVDRTKTRLMPVAVGLLFLALESDGMIPLSASKNS